MIYYPAMILKGENGYGVIIPDLPGCYPVGDTIDEAISDAKAAAAFHIEGLIEEGMDWNQSPRTIAEICTDAEFSETAKDATWFMLEFDETQFSRQIRFNVSWPEYLIKRVDEYAAANHETRSGFLAKAAQIAMNRQTNTTA